ncbi:MAG: PQQ-binding-like beta-propeller repeat protein, partial [Planctomycetota bacterium]
FDASSGKKLWAYETDNYVNGTPAVLGDRVVFGGCDAVLHVVSASTGKAIARVELGEGCHVAGSVALAGSKVYLGHYGNEFACVDLDKGKRQWSYPSPRHAFFSSPAIGRDRIVFGCRDKRLHCVRRSDGRPLWTFPTRRKVDGSPLICGDRVLFGSGDGRLYILALEDGKELWSYEIGQPLVSSPAWAQGMIVVGSHDKRLYAFKAASKSGR